MKCYVSLPVAYLLRLGIATNLWYILEPNVEYCFHLLVKLSNLHLSARPTCIFSEKHWKRLEYVLKLKKD